jgi:hypothetical protein
LKYFEAEHDPTVVSAYPICREYVKTLRHYRQRRWTCKYTGKRSLTYEEALSLEHAVDIVVSRFPLHHEAEAARIVHHSLKNADELATQISDLANDLDIRLAREWVNAVAYAEPVNGVPGVDCVWKLHEFFREKYHLPSELPEELAETLRPARTKSLGADRLDEESTEPNFQVRKLGEATALHTEAMMAANGDYDSSLSDWEDDDYKPSRFATEDLPWRARGRGRVRGRGLGQGQGRGKGRGRGRGRWSNGAGDDANNAVGNEGGLRPGGTTPGRTLVDTSSSKVQVPIIPTSIDLSQLHESLEDVEKRIQPGSIKHGVLTLLKEAGTTGMSINEIVDALQERGVKTWEEPRQARNSITSTCGHDSAFARIAPGRFALRCLLPSPKGEITPLTANLLAGSPDSKEAQQLAAVEAAQAEAMRRLAEQKSKARVGRNNFKCPKCHRVTHTEASPLVLCDTCPRAYHLACLPNNLSFNDLPAGDWCCPKCVDATQAALRRVMDLETRKKEALERAANKEKAVEEKLAKRLLSGQGDTETGVNGSKGGKGGISSGHGKGRGGGKGRAAAKVAQTSQGEGGEGEADQGQQESQQRPQQRPHRRAILDDWEVLNEEKDRLEKLQIRIKELEEVAAARGKPRVGEGGHVSTAETDDDKGELLLSKDDKKVIEDDSLVEKALTSLKETVEASKHLENVISGPPASFPRLVLSASAEDQIEDERKWGVISNGMGQASEAAMKEIITVAEFLALYGESCAIDAEPSAQELVAAVAWPLDHTHFLTSLYRQLLLCCLLALSDSPPPTHAKVERWLRILDDATWPEILRRYVRAVHIMPHILKERMRMQMLEEEEEDREEEDREEEEDGDVSNLDNTKTAAVQSRTGDEEKTKLQHQSDEYGKEYFVLDASIGTHDDLINDLIVEPEKVLHMDDKTFAVHGVRLLSRMAWWELPPAVHIRLLSLLCYDVAQGRTLRDDINERVLEYSKLLIEKSKGVAAFRRQKRSKDGVGAGAEGGGPKKKRKGKLGSGNQSGSRHNEDMVAEDGGEDGGEGDGNGDKDGQTGTDKDDLDAAFNAELKAVEAQYDAKLYRKTFRTEPLGLDRHHRRYWWLRGTPGCIFVEDGDDGTSVGVIASQVVLDDLLKKLNRRGPRERELYLALQRIYDEVVSSFSPPPPPTTMEDEGDVTARASNNAQLADLAASLNVLSFPRPVPTDGRVRQKDIPTLANMSFLSILGIAKAIMEALILDTVDALDVLVGLNLEKDALKTIRREVKGSESVGQLCLVLIGLEAAYSSSGEGLPRGADFENVETLMASEEDASCWKELLAKASATLFANQTNQVQDKNKVQVQEPISTELNGKEGDSAVQATNATNATNETTNITNNIDGQQWTDNNRSQGQGQVPEGNYYREFVSMDDDFDDSDAEHAYLREKRMRRPARLWRSGRERAVWIKSVCTTARNADLSTTSSQHGSAASQITYCAALLDDRVKKLIKVVHKLAEDAARYEEAAEMARVKAEAAKPSVKEVQPAGPVQRPLMIRTGKSKTEDGVKIVLKGMGKGPLPSARSSHAPGMEASVSDEVVAACRWGYQCSVCLLAGDLLCCEHPEQCAVSVHPECTGMPFPQGPWICTNHDERRLKGRMRARHSQGEGEGEGQGQGHGEKRDRRRMSEAEDSDATVSEGDGDRDSDATQDLDRNRSKRARRN